MLIKKSDRQARRGALAAALASQTGGGVDRRTFLRRSGLAAGGLAALGTLPLGGVRKAEAAGAGPAPAKGHHPAEHVHALLGGLHGAGRGRERRLGRPGARLGQPDQSRLALRQGRRHARDDARRSPAALPDEDGRRAVAAHLVGYGHQRDRRQAAGDPREVRPGFRLLAGLRQVHQRVRLPQPQVRGVLGHQQLGPPSAHLSLDHGRRRSQHLGLRRDDQQLQRHPQCQDHDHHGWQSGGSAPRVVAARARGQGAQPRQHDRDRSAADAHGSARHRICAPALRHRHPGHLRACSGTSSRTAGRTRSSSRSASTAWTTSARRSRSGRRRRSSACPACRVRSSSASPRCLRPRSQRR